MVSDNKLAVNFIETPYYVMNHISCSFQDTWLSLSFESLICSKVWISDFILFWVCWASWIGKLMIFVKFWKMFIIIFPIFFLLISFFFSSGTQIIHVLVDETMSLTSVRPFSFYFLFLSLDYISWSIYKFTDSIFCIPIIVLELLLWITFTLVILFHYSRIWFLFRISSSYWYFIFGETSFHTFL